MFDKNETKERRVPRRMVTDSDAVRRISQSIQQALDPETKQQSLSLYFTFFIFMLLVIGGLAYWQLRIRRRQEREVSDPLFLVQELNDAHQISAQEKRLMQDLAAENALPTPLKLFIEPQFFLDAMKKESYSPSRAALESLLSRLFSIEVQTHY